MSGLFRTQSAKVMDARLCGCGMLTSVPRDDDASVDDLGAAMLARHPRGEQWRQLDVTIAVLTFEQLARMGEIARQDPGQRAEARDRLISGIADPELAGRLSSRWVRWEHTFGLPIPTLDNTDPHTHLRHPYALAEAAHDRDADYFASVLAVFDAGLAIAAATTDSAGTADYDLLAAPWKQACSPSRFTATDAYGPHTQVALAALHHAVGVSEHTLRTLRRERATITQSEWDAARGAVADAAVAWGFPFRAMSLYWESVPAAEQAAGETPTDVHLVDALWGAAVTLTFAGRLNATIQDILLRPWQAADLPHPVV